MRRLTLKKIIIFTALLTMVCALLMILVLFVGEKTQKNVYGQTYYAVLSPMYENLKTTEGKKIVIVGNSSVPFGMDSELLEELLQQNGYEYSVCNFGLYGSLGTQLMLELAEDCIREGDIIVFMPEAMVQAQSLYFSATEFWYACEDNKSLISKLDKDLQAEMYANYPAYVSKRRQTKEEVSPSDIYALASFDEKMNLKNYERSGNVMQNMADINNPVALDEIILSEDYLEFVNDYYGKILKKGAEMYFMYGPVNEAGLTGDLEAYCKKIKEGYSFPVVGDFADSVMESDWFYDSNFHLNESGMTVFTLQVFNNLKTYWGDSKVTEYSLPEKPSEVKAPVLVTGDNSDDKYFIYEEKESGYWVTGLTEEGKKRMSLIVPVSHEDKPVVYVEVGSFKGATELRSVTFQSNIKTISNFLFETCRKLEKVVVKVSRPSEVSVGYHLLAGTEAKIYVPEASKNAYKNNYFWGYYAEDILGYE